MNTVIVKNCKTLFIGRRGENKVTEVLFDFSEWQEQFGAGVIDLYVKRNLDIDAYPVVLSVDGTVATWLVSAADTDVVGNGKIEYVYTVNEKIAKSAIFQFFVGDDIGESSPEPPEHYQSWLEQLTELGAETQANAQAAAQSASEAAESASEAAQSESNAAGSATTATTKAQEAADSAAQALIRMNSADASAQAAEAAQEAAEEALANIPSDYTDLSEDVDDLKSAVADQRQSFNYLPQDKYHGQIKRGNPCTINGRTYTVQPNGEILVTGTGTANSTFYIAATETLAGWSNFVLPAGTYRFYTNEDISAFASVKAKLGSESSYSMSFTENGNEYTFENDTVLVIALTIAKANVLPENGLLIQPMIAKVEEDYGYIAPWASLANYVPKIFNDIGIVQKGLADLEGIKTVKNLFNKDDENVLLGQYIQKSGSVVTNASYNETGYIPVKPGDVLWESHWTEGGTSSVPIKYYDSDFNRITGVGPITTPLTIPNNQRIAYVRCSVNIKYWDGLTISIGEKCGRYVPYNNYDVGIADWEESLYNALNGSQWSGKTWYAYGTSLTSPNVVGTYVPDLAKFSKMNVVNKGHGGSAICANSENKARIMDITDGKTEADLITIEVGANEGSATLGDIYDTSDNTFCGCLNQCIRYLQENTNAQIVVLSSSCHGRNPNDTSEYQYPDYVSAGGWTRFQMNEAIEKVCKVNGVYYIPMSEGIGFGFARIAYDMNKYIRDAIHHTPLGGYNIACGIWAYLKNIPLWYSELPT